jgi:hypothetical protein
MQRRREATAAREHCYSLTLLYFLISVRKFSFGANQFRDTVSFIPGAGGLVPRDDAPLDPAENADRR